MISFDGKDTVRVIGRKQLSVSEEGKLGFGYIHFRPTSVKLTTYVWCRCQMTITKRR